jgi:predicted nucleic-acid-binding Zn-ribbon protein
MKLFKKSEPQTIAVKGHELQCPVCGNKYFWIKRVLLNTSLATLFDLDWLNRRATCFICSDCTYIFWFSGKQ